MVLIAPDWNGRKERRSCAPTFYETGGLQVEAGIDPLAVAARPGTSPFPAPGDYLPLVVGQPGLTSLTGEITLWRPADGSDRLYAYHLHQRGHKFASAVECVGVCSIPTEELDELRVWVLPAGDADCCRCASPSGGLLAATKTRLIRFHCTVAHPPKLPRREDEIRRLLGRDHAEESLHLGGLLAPADPDGWPLPKGTQPKPPAFAWMALWVDARGRLVGGLELLDAATSVDDHSRRTPPETVPGRRSAADPLVRSTANEAIRAALDEVGHLALTEALREL
jgi:hypothetical protein